MRGAESALGWLAAVTQTTARRWVAEAFWPILLVVICIGFFWKLVLTSEYSWLDSPDYAYQVLPWYQFQASEWHAGRFPLWDPNHFGGQPLLAQMQPGAAYPLNWLLFLAPLRNGWIRQSYLHWYFVLIHVQAALFCYWLCRDLKRTPGASLLAGLAFGLGGFVGTNQWPQMLNGAVWAPLVLLFFLRAMRGERPVSSSAWSGAFLGIAFLSGHHQIPVFLCVAMTGAWLYYLALDRKRWKLLLLFGVFLILVAAFQSLPAYEYGKLSVRWAGAENPVGWRDTIPYSVHRQLALPPYSIFGIVIPGIFRNSDPFIGLVALTFALLGIVGAWTERTVRLFAAMALGGLLFATGDHSLLHGVNYALFPLVEKARNASVAIFIFHFGVCVLIAYGVDNYRSISETVLKRAIWILLGFTSVVGLVAAAFQIARTEADSRLGIVVLIGWLLAGILTAWRVERISSQAAIGCLTLLLLLDLGNVTNYGLRSQAEVKPLTKQLSEHSDIAKFLSMQDGPIRFDIEETELPYNFGDWYGMDHFGGYLASITSNVTRVQGIYRARLMNGVRYHVGSKPTRPDQVEVFAGANGVKVYQQPGAFPHAWTVHEVIAIRSDDHIRPQLGAAGFDPRRQTFVKGIAPELQKCTEGEAVKVLERESNFVSLEASLQCRGMVILADTYFPGWTATVDGKSASIYEAYGFLRGVVVEAGTHRIEMRYRPKSVYWGAALTGIGLLGAALLRARVE